MDRLGNDIFVHSLMGRCSTEKSLGNGFGFGKRIHTQFALQNQQTLFVLCHSCRAVTIESMKLDQFPVDRLSQFIRLQITVGKFVDIERPSFGDYYRQMLDRAASSKKGG